MPPSFQSILKQINFRRFPPVSSSSSFASITTTTTTTTSSNSNSSMTPSISTAGSPTRRFTGITMQHQQQHSRRWESNTITTKDHTVSMTPTTPAMTTIKPWPVALSSMIESHGDYRDEMWLEDHIGGPLYTYQTTSLPTLPIRTDLQTTIHQLLPTIVPLAKDPIEITNLQSSAHKFIHQASQLQKRLNEHAKQIGNTSSWLQQWWNTYCYLQVRDSVVINVSYFFHFTHDPTSLNIVQRTASILYATAQFRNRICTGQFPAEQIGKNKTPLCSVAYKYMFHACRIPQNNQDTYRIYDPARYHHAIVSIRGQYYKVPFIDPTTYESYALSTLEKAIERCIEYANAIQMNNNPNQLQLGWCTSSNRDTWANVRNQLLQIGGIDMEHALRDIESGAVLICLDVDDVVVSRNEIAQMLLHGRSQPAHKSNDNTTTTMTNTKNDNVASGGNRWFDKSIQLIVSADGRAAGLLGEHSMMDGMPVVQLANYITNMNYTDCCHDSNSRNNNNNSANDNSTDAAVNTVQPIFTPALYTKIHSVAESCIDVAKNEFRELVDNNSLHVQSFQGYGSTFIKQSGYSPDAFVQMAIQIATYRLWGEQAGTYEATQVRPFLHGRTETTRSVSLESAALVKKFGLRPANDETNDTIRKEKLQLFQSAVKTHVKYTQDASQAHGVDRHLLGLSMLVKNGEALPDLYSDPVFQRGKRWRVSTSHLTHPKFDNWGYGQVVPDGVGLAYSIHPRQCIFNITALKHTGWTDKLSQLLEEALLELRTLIEIDTIESSPRTTSKL